MNKELKEALDVLEKEKEISKETLFEAIENSLLTACKQHFGKADNVKVEIDRDTCDFLCYCLLYTSHLSKAALPPFFPVETQIRFPKSRPPEFPAPQAVQSAARTGFL